MIRPAVLELRVAGLKAAKLNPSDFVDPRKAASLALILREYEQRLSENQLFDEGDIWDAALRQLAAMNSSSTHAANQGQSRALYILPSLVDLSTREEEFLTKDSP